MNKYEEGVNGTDENNKIIMSERLYYLNLINNQIYELVPKNVSPFTDLHNNKKENKEMCKDISKLPIGCCGASAVVYNGEAVGSPMKVKKNIKLKVDKLKTKEITDQILNDVLYAVDNYTNIFYTKTKLMYPVLKEINKQLVGIDKKVIIFNNVLHSLDKYTNNTNIYSDISLINIFCNVVYKDSRVFILILKEDYDRDKIKEILDCFKDNKYGHKLIIFNEVDKKNYYSTPQKRSDIKSTEYLLTFMNFDNCAYMCTVNWESDKLFKITNGKRYGEFKIKNNTKE